MGSPPPVAAGGDFGYHAGMLRASIVIGLTLFTLALGACGKCGPDFGRPGACHSDAPAR